MAGGVSEGEAVEGAVFFKVHFSLKAGLVGGVFDQAFAGDDISLFGSEKRTDVVNRLAVVVILAGHMRFFSSFRAF